jgi:hypothetical protein
MKRTLLLLLFSMTIIWANAQRGYGNHYHHQPRYGGGGYCAPPRPVIYAQAGFGCNNYYRPRPFINVVIAPRPSVVIAPPPPNPQPQIVREWVEPHWEDGSNGRFWVEGHYIQREVY